MFNNNEGPRRANEWRRRPHHNDEDFGPGGYGGGRGPGGPGGFGPGGFGPGRGHGRGGRPFGFMPRDFMFGPGRGPQVRRGDVRLAILVLLAEEPMHGYQIIQNLGERSGGVWRPSAGSVYPTLQLLEDEGLVRGQEKDGRNVFALTDEGRTAATEAAKSPAPWKMPGAGADDAATLFALFQPLAGAVAEVHRTGDPETIAKARAILTDARRSLYRLLAEDDEPAAE